MAFVKKTWVDRVTERPNRRTLTNTATQEQITVDVVRSEGNVSTEGDALDAENLNGLENRIDTAITAVENSISPILKTITEVKKVSAIPSDAANHPTTLYIITE